MSPGPSVWLRSEAADVRRNDEALQQRSRAQGVGYGKTNYMSKHFRAVFISVVATSVTLALVV